MTMHAHTYICTHSYVCVCPCLPTPGLICPELPWSAMICPGLTMLSEVSDSCHSVCMCDPGMLNLAALVVCETPQKCSMVCTTHSHSL